MEVSPKRSEVYVIEMSRCDTALCKPAILELYLKLYSNQYNIIWGGLIFFIGNYLQVGKCQNSINVISKGSRNEFTGVQKVELIGWWINEFILVFVWVGLAFMKSFTVCIFSVNVIYRNLYIHNCLTLPLELPHGYVDNVILWNMLEEMDIGGVSIVFLALLFLFSTFYWQICLLFSHLFSFPDSLLIP